MLSEDIHVRKDHARHASLASLKQVEPRMPQPQQRENSVQSERPHQPPSDGTESVTRGQHGPIYESGTTAETPQGSGDLGDGDVRHGAQQEASDDGKVEVDSEQPTHEQGT